MSGAQTVTVNGAGFPGLGVILFVVFLVLKLTGVIAWAWLWVTAPLWIPVVVFLVFGMFLLLALVALALAGKRH